MMGETRLVDETTVRAIRDYLHAHFKADRVVPFVDHGVQGFRIDDIFGTPRHVLAVTSDFFGAHAVPAIPSALDHLRVAETLRQAGRTPVEVSASGVKMTDPSRPRNVSGGPEKRQG
jgi:hypothetical protein